MPVQKNREIARGFHHFGNQAFSFYLIESGREAALFDAGLSISAPALLEDLQGILGDRCRLTFLFLTHSHFDHCGSISMLKRFFPEVCVAASAHAASVFTKEKALQEIRRLNRIFEQAVGFEESFPHLAPSITTIPVDRILMDGEIFSVGKWKVEVMATPGHTSCSLSYYLPEAGAMIPGEAAGAMDLHGKPFPEFLSSCSRYRESLLRIASREISFLCLPHGGFLEEKETSRFLQESLSATDELRERLLSMREKGMDDEEAAAFLSEKEGLKNRLLQPPEIFEMNLRAMFQAASR